VLAVGHNEDRGLALAQLQQAAAALVAGGKLLAAIDRRRDLWLQGAIRKAFGSATIARSDRHGAVYIARKRGGPSEEAAAGAPRRRFHAALFGQELCLETAPGVFSHGELDQGTLALAERAPLENAACVLDLGCGGGALGLAAALADARRRAVLVDSSALATRCARRNALAHGLGRRALVLTAADLAAIRPGAVDLVLANPPYFGDFRISELFVRESARVLAPGGRLHLVTRAPERHRGIFAEHFGNCEETSRRGYSVLSAVSPGEAVARSSPRSAQRKEDG
jgi:16S rRNA (guanine1207-N2)-methyltransferase